MDAGSVARISTNVTTNSPALTSEKPKTKALTGKTCGNANWSTLQVPLLGCIAKDLDVESWKQGRRVCKLWFNCFTLPHIMSEVFKGTYPTSFGRRVDAHNYQVALQSAKLGGGGVPRFSATEYTTGRAPDCLATCDWQLVTVDNTCKDNGFTVVARSILHGEEIRDGKNGRKFTQPVLQSRRPSVAVGEDHRTVIVGMKNRGNAAEVHQSALVRLDLTSGKLHTAFKTGSPVEALDCCGNILVASQISNTGPANIVRIFDIRNPVAIAETPLTHLALSLKTDGTRVFAACGRGGVTTIDLRMHGRALPEFTCLVPRGYRANYTPSIDIQGSTVATLTCHTRDDIVDNCVPAYASYSVSCFNMNSDPSKAAPETVSFSTSSPFGTSAFAKPRVKLHDNITVLSQGSNVKVLNTKTMYTLADLSTCTNGWGFSRINLTDFVVFGGTIVATDAVSPRLWAWDSTRVNSDWDEQDLRSPKAAEAMVSPPSAPAGATKTTTAGPYITPLASVGSALNQPRAPKVSGLDQPEKVKEKGQEQQPKKPLNLAFIEDWFG